MSEGKVDGVRETGEVAGALRDECVSPNAGDKIVISEIWSGTHLYTKQTANIFSEATGAKVSDQSDLDPEYFVTSGAKELSAKLRGHVAGIKNGNALLVVGHEPLLGMLQQLCRRSMPLRNSDVVCIELNGASKGRILWVLSAIRDEQTMYELKQKIRSKMATAKLLGAVISALLGFSLATLMEPERFERLEALKEAGVMKLGMGFLLAGLASYLLTMYAYDSLLMPVRLWTTGRSAKRPAWLVARPPSSAMLVIYLNMVNIWDWLFTPATWMVFLGLLCLSWAVFAPSPLLLIGVNASDLGWLGQVFSAHPEPITAAVIAAIVVILYFKGRPVLGSRD